MFPKPKAASPPAGACAGLSPRQSHGQYSTVCGAWKLTKPCHPIISLDPLSDSHPFPLRFPGLLSSPQESPPRGHPRCGGGAVTCEPVLCTPASGLWVADTRGFPRQAQNTLDFLTVFSSSHTMRALMGFPEGTAGSHAGHGWRKPALLTTLPQGGRQSWSLPIPRPGAQ